MMFIAALLVALLTYGVIAIVYFKKKGDEDVKLQSNDAMGEES